MKHDGDQNRPGQERPRAAWAALTPGAERLGAGRAVPLLPPVENTTGRRRITEMSIRTGLVLSEDVCDVKIMVGKTACNLYTTTPVIITDMVDSHGTKNHRRPR